MVGSSSQETDRIGSVARAERAMDYFAGLDVSMEETHVCVVDRDGLVIHEIRRPHADHAIILRKKGCNIHCVFRLTSVFMDDPSSPFSQSDERSRYPMPVSVKM